ncbi:UNVERIFIED_CONTAM: addiction module antitoxin RelB [Streptococcus canis]|uniref:type II toxin-antitoxin system RelB/ParD family antitoxin n=1 Tax=Streptococcus hyointestinalis TaxID=1337 RepID=UPI0013E0E7C2|nr:addiction module antitoxin RelB [Streptococcus hyointestinalis]
MTTITKNSQFSFRTNEDLLSKAKEIVSYENIDMSTLFNNLLIQVVNQGQVPSLLLNEEQSKKERIIDELYGEIQQGYQSYLEGEGKSLDEVFAKYGA